MCSLFKIRRIKNFIFLPLFFSFLIFLFIEKRPILEEQNVDEPCPHEFTKDGILRCWNNQPYANLSLGSGDECDQMDGITYVFMNQHGMIASIEQQIGQKVVYSYNLDRVIELWGKYNRFTDNLLDSKFDKNMIRYDYFMKRGIPYFSDSIFCDPNGNAFSGEIISSWSSLCIPPTSGYSKITFRQGVLWQIAETRQDSSIAYGFDMDKIIYIYNNFNSFRERHVESNSALAGDFLFCTDSSCHMYHPLESLSRNILWGPPNYE